jgi:uncharacterized protein
VKTFRNSTRNVVLSDRTRIADNMLTRMVGLLSSKGLAPGEGLYIEPCNSIHTWFMRFTIDALFLDKNGSVVKMAPRMKPWKLTSIALKSRGVLELPEGTIERTGTQLGDQVERA